MLIAACISDRLYHDDNVDSDVADNDNVDDVDGFNDADGDSEDLRRSRCHKAARV